MTENIPTTFNNLTDSQLQQAFSQINAVAASHYVSPTPQVANSKAYMRNLHTWSTTSTPPPRAQSSAQRTARVRPRATAPATQYTPYQQSQPIPVLPTATVIAQPNPPRPPLPTTPQALQSTYASRLRTGTTLLMQPILQSSSLTSTRTSSRRGGTVINYADPGSGDDLPDAGALDSDDSDFVASGGTRTAVRQQTQTRSGRMQQGMGVFSSITGSPHPQAQTKPQDKTELDQSYLGAEPPARFIKARNMAPTAHEYPSQDQLELQARRSASLVPIRVEFETDTHRIRDCFVWNLNETLVKPETFAKIFCNDLDLPLVPWQETVTNQIRAQLEDHEPVASMELGGDASVDLDKLILDGEELPECRVIISIDVQIANHHLLDHFEWDLLSPLTPEAFSTKLCTELGLTGEAVPLITHAIHEELIKHKKDAIEWGVIGGEREPLDESAAPIASVNAATTTIPNNTTATMASITASTGTRTGSLPPGGTNVKEKSSYGLVKDKTGLGLSWGRAPKDGRGPKTLRSVWRDWAESEEFRTRFEVLSAEEVERREIEKERASRRLRRETSKFQSTRSRRR